jgi:hypothetical protein
MAEVWIDSSSDCSGNSSKNDNSGEESDDSNETHDELLTLSDSEDSVIDDSMNGNIIFIRYIIY